MSARCWLLKSEPGTYSIDDLRREGKTSWEGVRNFQARNFLRDEIKQGDRILFYHSSAEPPGVAGTGEIARGGYPEKTSPWFAVDVKFAEKFNNFVPLEALKANPALAGMLVLKRGMRLSVQPVEKKHYDAVCKMGR